MRVTKLYLHHFRNYTQAEISFSPGVNWITGKNGQGKTNLIEALYFLSTGRSFRTHQLSQLIQKGAPFFYLEAEIEKEGVRQTLKASFDGETKKVQYNSKSYTHFTPLIGLLPHVLYAPEDIALVAGAPLYRRKFLDMHLAQFDPLYLHHLARYHKAMRQRNELLKKKIEETIDPWEEMMAQSSEYLIQKREDLVAELHHPLNESMQFLSEGTDPIGIHYEGSLTQRKREAILIQLQKNRKKELHIGATLNGPHRDDVYFEIEGLSAKAFASEGQKHSIIASLRLCECDHLKDQINTPPLMSIDDFGAHLDLERQTRFQEKLATLGQIFITSPRLSPEIFPNKTLIQIDSGQMLHISSS